MLKRKPISVSDAIAMLEEEELVLESAANSDREFTSEDISSWEQSVTQQLQAAAS